MAHWQNRIVGTGDEAPDQILANPSNWRIHPKTQRKALDAVLTEVGLVQTVIINKRTGRLVDGHLRVDLAMERGEPSVPVTYVDLSEEEERKILTTFDPLGTLAVADREQLAGLLATVNSPDQDLQALLKKLATPPGTEAVSFEAASAEAEICPTCGQKIKH